MTASLQFLIMKRCTRANHTALSTGRRAGKSALTPLICHTHPLATDQLMPAHAFLKTMKSSWFCHVKFLVVYAFVVSWPLSCSYPCWHSAEEALMRTCWNWLYKALDCGLCHLLHARPSLWLCAFLSPLSRAPFPLCGRYQGIPPLHVLEWFDDTFFLGTATVAFLREPLRKSIARRSHLLCSVLPHTVMSTFYGQGVAAA